MFTDEASYQISKLLRRIKIVINNTDRAQVLRTVGILLVALTVLGTPAQKTRTLGTEVRNSKLEAGNEAGSLKLDESSLLPPASPPVSSFQPQASAPTISAQAVFVIDNETDAVLYEKNADQRLPMASLTKIMTAVVVLDEYQLDEIVSVPEVCTHLPPNEVGLESNEKIGVEGFLYGMLVASGSDAACALSHHFDGDFLALMNKKAEDLYLSQTHFENEVGLDGEDGNHLSTARDLVKLSKEALKNGVFRKIVGTQQVSVANADQTRWHNLTSTNELLFTLPGTTGVKTGLTKQAGGCLAVSYERNGREIIGVILASDDRFVDMREILNWVFEVYQFPN